MHKIIHYILYTYLRVDGVGEYGRDGVGVPAEHVDLVLRADVPIYTCVY